MKTRCRAVEQRTRQKARSLPRRPFGGVRRIACGDDLGPQVTVWPACVRARGTPKMPQQILGGWCLASAALHAEPQIDHQLGRYMTTSWPSTTSR